MSQAKLPSRVRINEEGLNQVRLRMDQLEKPRNPDKKGWVKEDLVEKAYVSLSTVKRFLGGKPCYRNIVISILETLNFEAQAFITKYDLNLNSTNKEPKLDIMIDWQQVCREMLQEQQEEQRFRRRATEQGFELNVYVPLGLVERKEQQRRSGILPMEQIHQLKQEVITRIYQHDEFLNDVIGQQSVGKNKHIAIVGEPGAGKTTLLDNIATYIQKNTEDLPICISLASLQGRTLKNYILEEWLPEAISLTYPDVFVETFHETSLQKLQKRLRQGGVWLLLDGVDEIGETSPVKALERIQNQLSDWLGKVRVVLTCRTNVWDAQTNNPLTGFETYKTQNFSQGDVRRFIKQWFGFARKPQLGKLLREKLNQPQSDRIRQLVENPLRLALLCQVFYRDEKAEFPETKAGLYELFVRYFYEWKPTLSSVDWTTQLGLKEELHQALGRLSIAGLDSDARFRLPESLIKKELDDRLFKLAWELGWLNLVDREAKTDEPVYAFFHPTFQEYFAALNIPSEVNIPIWDYFLPSDHNNNNPKPVDGKKYRIFEPQWKEVTLLWLGLKKVEKEQKEQFIKALVNFDDGCEKFYHYRAYFLAASGIAEFTQYPLADEIIDKLVDLAAWNTGYLMSFGDTAIADAAKAALEETDSNRIIKPLNQLLQIELPNDLLKRKFLEICRMLSKINGGKSKAIKALYELIRSYKSIDIVDKSIKRDLFIILREIETDQNQDNQGQIQAIKDDEQSDLVANLIIDLGSNKREPLSKQEAFYQINKLAENSYIPPGIIGLLKNMLAASDETSRLKAAKIIEEIYSGDSYFIDEEPRSQVLWHCAQNMSYPEFYQAWHEPTTTHLEAPNNIPVGKSSTTQYLNFTQLPSILDSAIANDEELNKAVKLICIDGSYFSDLNNPATDIYIEMVEQGCPERQEEPNTMQQLKKYWRLDLRKLEKRIALLFYNSKIDRTLNPSFLSDIATFGGTIAIISDEHCNNVRLISPNDLNLIDTILKWLKREISEA